MSKGHTFRVIVDAIMISARLIGGTGAALKHEYSIGTVLFAMAFIIMRLLEMGLKA